MEQFFKDLEGLSMPNEGSPFDMGFFDAYQFDTFIQTLEKRPDDEVIRFLRSNLSYIATLILDKKWNYSDIFESEKFLRCYTIAVSTAPVNSSIRIATNSFCYNLIVDDPKYRNRNDLNPQIDKLAQAINGMYIDQLLTCDITRNNAVEIAISRFSSLKEEVNIKRVNFDIEIISEEIMTEQKIVWIYEKLFDRIGSLFKWTMLEVYSPDQKLELNERKRMIDGNNNSSDTPFSNCYDLISLAILDILNNMPLAAIEQVVSRYITDWRYMGKPPVRFSLRELSADYSRINTIVNSLMNSNFYVP